MDRALPAHTVPFPDAPVDPFFNANRPEDLLLAETLLPKVAS